METNTKHNIFKDYTDYEGTIVALWKTGAEKAPKFWNTKSTKKNKFMKVPSGSMVAVIETTCGKEIRFTLAGGERTDGWVYETATYGLTQVGTIDSYRFFWKKGEKIYRHYDANPQQVTVRLHNVWFPKDNPSRGYATQMPNDGIKSSAIDTIDHTY